MDWDFTEEQDELAALVRQILEREVTEEQRRATDATADRVDLDLHRTLAAAGVLGGFGPIELCRVLVEVGRAVAPVPLLPNAIAAEAIARFGSEELRDAWVTPSLLGEAILTVALTNDFGVPTVASKSEHGWSIRGGKTTVPAGTIADLFCVSVTTQEGGDPMVVLVARDAPGVTIEPQIVTSTQVEAHVTFDDAQALDVLGGPEVVQWLFDHLVVATCAHQLGVCERAVELTAEYAKERVQFDRPIATFQAVGQRLADAYIDVQAVRLTLWQAAWRLAEGLPADQEIATAKFWASDAGHRVAHTAVHVHGGMGIDLDYHLHRYFTAAKRNEFAFGGATKPLVALGERLATEPA